MNRVSSWNSHLIHDKGVPNTVTSQCHITISPFRFSSEWAASEAHNFALRLKNCIKISAGEALLAYTNGYRHNRVRNRTTSKCTKLLRL